jgi:hypothetical protein
MTLELSRLFAVIAPALAALVVPTVAIVIDRVSLVDRCWIGLDVHRRDIDLRVHRWMRVGDDRAPRRKAGGERDEEGNSSGARGQYASNVTGRLERAKRVKD